MGVGDLGGVERGNKRVYARQATDRGPRRTTNETKGKCAGTIEDGWQDRGMGGGGTGYGARENLGLKSMGGYALEGFGFGRGLGRGKDWIGIGLGSWKDMGWEDLGWKGMDGWRRMDDTPRSRCKPPTRGPRRSTHDDLLEQYRLSNHDRE